MREPTRSSAAMAPSRCEMSRAPLATANGARDVGAARGSGCGRSRSHLAVPEALEGHHER
ncbi:hypothetical protein GCM10011612_04270 [Actinomyces gaoshouyii]|uniref:Uncharacterized protein n=1 Tax=Actinomyces gaoshouyii TaxID=1960083 RepID=A0A8H9HC00_9ACTO|nr:hypothetical protein GCM10011612_04270 [Actinomyces gaoshouyii]